MLVRVIERADGGVSIIRPVRGRRVDRFGVVESDREYYDDVFGKAIARDPKLIGRPYTDVDASTLPADRADREHWKLKSGKVVNERPGSGR